MKKALFILLIFIVGFIVGNVYAGFKLMKVLHIPIIEYKEDTKPVINIPFIR